MQDFNKLTSFSVLGISIPSFNNDYLIRDQIRLLSSHQKIVQLNINDQTPIDTLTKQKISNFVKNSPNATYKDTSCFNFNAVDNWNFSLNNLPYAKYNQLRHHDDLLAGSELALPIFVSNLFESNEELLIMPHIKIIKTQRIGDKMFAKCIFHCHPRLLKLLLNLDKSLLIYFNYLGPTASILFKTKAPPLFNSSLKWLVDVDWYISILNRYNKAKILKIYNYTYYSGSSITESLSSSISQIKEKEIKILTSSWTKRKRVRIICLAVLLKCVSTLTNWFTFFTSPIYLEL